VGSGGKICFYSENYITKKKRCRTQGPALVNVNRVVHTFMAVLLR
jgi:hypothetical protein